MGEEGYMKKVLRGTLISTGIVVLLIAAAYCSMGLYYKGGFPCFTWVNGVYCTGKTVAEVNQELLHDEPYEGIAVLDESGARLFISAEDAGYSKDYTEALNKFIKTRSPLAWGLYAFDNTKYRIDPVITVDRDKVDKIVADWEIFVDPDDFECSIKKTSDGYVLENACVTVPVEETVSEHVYNALLRGNTVLDLAAAGDCYTDVDLRGGEKEKMDLFAKIDSLQKMSVTYSVGDDEVVFDSFDVSNAIMTEEDYEKAIESKPGSKVLGAGRYIIDGQEAELPSEDEVRFLEDIVVDSNGNPIVSENKIYAFFEDVADRYGTKNLMDMYRKGLSNTVIVNDSSKGNGSIFDINTEYEHLREKMMDGGSDTPEKRQFALADTATSIDAKKSLGDTYIEVNMGDQELRYYVDGKLDMKFPIVTGNINRGRGTPAGVYNIYNKRYHTYLRGADYVSYVNYWLGVNKGIGIHDALWRDEFGEDIYKSDGSHGCINCPLDSVETLWEIAEVGTPVILYY